MAETATSVMKEGVDSVAEQMYTPQITGRAVRQSLFTISRAMRVRVAASTVLAVVSQLTANFATRPKTSNL